MIQFEAFHTLAQGPNYLDHIKHCINIKIPAPVPGRPLLAASPPIMWPTVDFHEKSLALPLFSPADLLHRLVALYVVALAQAMAIHVWMSSPPPL